ncbi:hypothetical protein RBH26_06930 [Natronolimnohabitans sp. A-GB9]|uniref:poly-gamma-glutamate hydrolase family protein n=1 Tax=Natronolimnohabitans sp. A-GB9 TaxID=3069757 RepID=UPI0027AF3F23|nr:hypothetical protein [Natronolimnohabitans sp. A-GB9]MDQ2050215.1 hypothetical protein [Natronolimnohabitans sp. A-GB9]
MTDDTTSDDTDEQHRSSSSRRKFLGATLASPALLGLGVGSYEAATRHDGSYDTALVRDLADGQDDLVLDQTAVSADPRLLSDWDLSVGQQIRLTRTDGEFAAYTITEERPESTEESVRMPDSGKSRLDLGPSGRTPSDDRNGCPGPVTDHSLDDEFEAEISSTVPASDLSARDARREGELVEQLDERDSSLVMIAPHGGGMQPWTDEQAAYAADLTSATSWRALGWGPTPASGAFQRWYVPSTEIDPASYPKLEQIADTEFDVAVDFGGVCERGIEVGGNADESLRIAVRDSINEALPSRVLEAELSDDPTGAADSMLVNRLGDDGIFLSQSYTTRLAYHEEIAYGVAAALDDDLDPGAQQPPGRGRRRSRPPGNPQNR